MGRLHALVGEHADDPGQVVVGIEVDRGLLVGSLVAAGDQVYAVNPKSVDRYPRPPRCVGAAGGVVGFLTGLFGVGGGFVIVVVNSVAGLVAHLGQSTIDLATGATFTAGGVLAALSGGRLSRAADGRRLTRWFGVLVCGR